MVNTRAFEVSLLADEGWDYHFVVPEDWEEFVSDFWAGYSDIPEDEPMDPITIAMNMEDYMVGTISNFDFQLDPRLPAFSSEITYGEIHNYAFENYFDALLFDIYMYTAKHHIVTWEDLAKDENTDGLFPMKGVW